MLTQSLEELKSAFRGELIQPTDAAYESARRVYNGMIDKRPRLIARCVDVADVIAAVPLEQLIAEPQHLRLVGDVAGMTGDGDAGRSAGPGQGRGLLNRVRVPVAGRDRASGRRQLADQLAAHARASAGHHCELPSKRVHRRAPPSDASLPAATAGRAQN